MFILFQIRIIIIISNTLFTIYAFLNFSTRLKPILTLRKNYFKAHIYGRMQILLYFANELFLNMTILWK